MVNFDLGMLNLFFLNCKFPWENFLIGNSNIIWFSVSQVISLVLLSANEI